MAVCTPSVLPSVGRHVSLSKLTRTNGRSGNPVGSVTVPDEPSGLAATAASVPAGADVDGALQPTIDRADRHAAASLNCDKFICLLSMSLVLRSWSWSVL